MADEWKVVKVRPKKSGRGNTDSTRAPTKRQHHEAKSQDQANDVPPDADLVDGTVRRCKLSMQSLSVTVFYEELAAKMFQFVPNLSSIVSLGLGSPCNSISSLLQTALLLCLKANKPAMKTDCAHSMNESRIIVSAFEPGFSAEDREVCRLLGINISQRNTMGKCDCKDGSCLGSGECVESETLPGAGPHSSRGDGDGDCDATEKSALTLFYMPHCPYRLYVNVLWANWHHLENIAILGNSFSSYGLRRSLGNSVDVDGSEERSDCVKLLESLVTEVPVWEEYRALCKKKGIDDSHVADDMGYLENAFCDMR
jgi:SRR1